MIDLAKCEEGYEVYYSANGMFLGHLSVTDDGYYHYFPATGRGGYWSQEWLEALVEKMKELNEEWDAQVKQEVGGEHGQ